MTYIWTVDTCGCQLEYTNNGNSRDYFKKHVKKCNLHKILNGLALHDAVVAHNQNLNLDLSLTKFERLQKKDAELERIRNMR